MDDLVRRVGRLEEVTTDTRVSVSAIQAQIPHIATKDDVSQVSTKISSTETSIIKWLVGVSIALASVAFAAARLIP